MGEAVRCLRLSRDYLMVALALAIYASNTDCALDGHCDEVGDSEWLRQFALGPG